MSKREMASTIMTMRTYVQTLGVAAAALMALGGGAFAEAKAVTDPGKVLVAETVKSAAPVAAAKPQLAERPKPRSLHQFRDKAATMTFTNRPDKYKSRNDFVEVSIRYERIPLPPKYTPAPRLTAPSVVPRNIEDATLRDIVKRYSTIYGLDESLVYAVIHAESAFDPDAVSPAGARGLMQLMPGTALEMGVSDIFDPLQNVAGGTQYLSKMMDLFQDKQLAVAAYNAGPENVKKYGTIPPFDETQSYVKIVMDLEQAYRKDGFVPNVRMANTQKYHFHHSLGKAPAKGSFTICFHSGLTQPADRVVDKEPYWFIEYANRSYPVRKDLVKSIEKAA